MTSNQELLLKVRSILKLKSPAKPKKKKEAKK